MIKEPTKKIVEHIQSRGIICELHSCGDIRALIPEIADDLGVDGLNIMKLNDIPAMKKLTGIKVVYNVYVDTQKEEAGGTGSSLLFLSNQKAEGYHWGWR